MNKFMIVAVSSFMGVAAFADETPVDTKEWVKEAGTAINEVMIYPRVAHSHGVTGTASYKVTIDRAGNVVNYYTVSSTGKKSLDKASERALKLAYFPSIPKTFSGDQLTFSLEMSYRPQESKARQFFLDAKRSKGSVSGARIALLGGTSIAAAK